MVTFAGCTLPVLALIPMMIGIEPGMSIMAKRTIKLATISRKSNCIIKIFAKIVKSSRQSPVGSLKLLIIV